MSQSSVVGSHTHHIYKLMVTGVSMGVLHVLAGPDHLSALATLAVGNSWRALTLGIRWGLGHSTGLIVVAIIFILLKGELDLRTIGRYCDLLVGIFMVILGALGIGSSMKMYKEKRFKKLSEEDDIVIVEPNKKLISKIFSSSSLSSDNLSNQSISTKIINPNNSNTIINIISGSDDSTVDINANFSDNGSLTNVREPNQHFKVKSSTHQQNISIISAVTNIAIRCTKLDFEWLDMHEPVTQRIVSFTIGLLHGIAGPGGILGVLPAVEMRCWHSAFIYLGSFVLASTFSMGLFASLYGEATKRLGATAESVELGLRIFSSAMSIIVGALWLVLSCLGKLDHFFH